MSAEKLSGMNAIEQLRKYQGSQKDDAVSARIDHICYIIKRLSDDEVNRIDSLKALLEILENADSKSRLVNPNDYLTAALDDLQKVKLKDTYKADATDKEVKKYTAGKKKRMWISILFFVLLGCGAVGTAVFALLDNFNVIDYGGTAAGAAGIIDFVIGITGFIVERVSDSKTTSAMQGANAVHDSASYRYYIKDSFHHIKVIDKRKTTNKTYNGKYNDTEEDSNE